MGSFSNYTELKVLDHALKTAAFTQPTGLYIALSTTTIADDGSGMTEPAVGAYARVACNTWNAASSRSVANTGTISFPEASAAWGTITYFAVMDAATGGNMIAYGALSASKTIAFGDNASFQSGAITVSFNTGGIGTYLANKILDHIFKTAAYTQATHLYVALSKANPADDNSGLDEPAVGAYARVVKDTWSAASGGATSNTGAITFPQATIGWGTVTHFAILDAATVGNLLFYAALDSARNIGVNDTPSFGDSALNLTID
jgi:hypothetical protein